MRVISAFVAAGFEHSVANMYFLSAGFMLQGDLVNPGFIRNLVPVTLGNIAGGGIMVALVYFIVYRLHVNRTEG